MSKDLTLSVIVPERNIRKSLALALVDIDSHIYSLRYKSFEIVVVSSEDGIGDEIVDKFQEIMPNLISARSDNWQEKVKGRNVVVVNSDFGISYDRLKRVKEFFKEDDEFVILSPKRTDKKSNFLDKITNFLMRILGFNFDDYPAHSYLIYMEQDLINEYPALNPESSFIRSQLDGLDVNILKTHNEGINPVSYFKLWGHLIDQKSKIIWKDIKSRVKAKFNKKS